MKDIVYIEAGDNIVDAKAAAAKYSKKNPGVYVTLSSLFGTAFIHADKHLHIFAPTSTIGGIYWKAGKEKPFTDAQKIADQNATPNMS